MTTLRAAALGVATGARSTLGLTALALTIPGPGWGRRRTTWIHGPWPGRIAVLACAGELLGDKLSRTPSRLEPAPQLARLALGGLSGGLLAHRETRSPVRTALGVIGGVSGAAAGTHLGAAWRSWAGERCDGDLLGAVVEDVAAIALARLGVG